MAIPDYESIMLPLLKFSENRNEFSSKDAVTNMATEFALKEEEKNALLPNGKQTIIYNRVHWALSYLKHSKLLENIKKGVYKITDRGKQVLSQNPAKIDSELLKQFPEYVDFINRTSTKEKGRSDIIESDASQTPEEKFEESYQIIRDDLKSQLLDTIKGCSPIFPKRIPTSCMN
jgi:restriction system protein